MKKIPIENIAFWKATQAVVSQTKYIVRRLLKAEPDRRKRNALRPLWTQLLNLLSEAPYKKEWQETFALSIAMVMTMTQIQIVLSQTRKPEMMEGGVVVQPSKRAQTYSKY